MEVLILPPFETQNIFVWKNEKNHLSVTPSETFAVKESQWMLETLSEGN